MTAPAAAAEDLVARLEQLYTGILFDVMRTLGAHAGVLPPQLQAVGPDMLLAGPVWTVHGRLVDGAEPTRPCSTGPGCCRPRRPGA